jgi:hypothetical protein
VSIPTSERTDDRRAKVEAWWPPIARIVAFLIGAGICVQQSLVPNPPGAQESLLALAIGLMGPFGASLFASGAERVRGGGHE